MYNIAVYGTLRKQCYNHKFLLKNAVDYQYKPSIIMGYEIRIDLRTHLPFAIKSVLYDKLVCELIKVDKNGLEMLDHFEGEGSMYERCQVHDINNEPCFIYIGIISEHKVFELENSISISQYNLSDYVEYLTIIKKI
jgi:gamma-glutamylcyclotransferase (GGCT)/AIG2-like uncharacterized protein YtfP